jgi:hypothetical protein
MCLFTIDIAFPAEQENYLINCSFVKLQVGRSGRSFCPVTPTFRSYFWELASEAGLHCRDDRKLSFTKPLRKPFTIQTAECGLHKIAQILGVPLGHLRKAP